MRNRLILVFIILMTAIPLFTLERIELRRDIEFVPLTPTIWRHVTYQETENWGNVPANGLLVLDGKQAALVDTPWTPEQTAFLLEWLEKNRHVRVSVAVVTHSHPDRLGGLPEIRRRNIRSIGLEKTRSLALEANVEAPQETFTAERSVTLGSRELLLFYPGAGHTVDNIVVWIGDEQVLFGGCLVKSRDALNLGNTSESDLKAWPSTLGAVREKFPTIRTVVPGHGDPGGGELIDHTIRLLTESPGNKM
jgi:metallo-beta-lactamase class B